MGRGSIVARTVIRNVGVPALPSSPLYFGLRVVGGGPGVVWRTS